MTCCEILRIVQWQSCILQTRTKFPKPFVVLDVWWSGKYFLAPNFRKAWTKLASARGFTFQANTKIGLLRASMVVTYYIKRFRRGTDKHNGILMSLLLPVAETMRRRKCSKNIVGRGASRGEGIDTKEVRKNREGVKTMSIKSLTPSFPWSQHNILPKEYLFKRCWFSIFSNQFAVPQKTYKAF